MDDITIIKYLAKETTQEENGVVEAWILESEENAKKFALLKVDYIKSQFNISEVHPELESAYQDFRQKNIKREKRIVFNRSFLKYAAILILFISTSYYFTATLLFNSDNEYPSQQLQIKDEPVLLKLDDGTTQQIGQDSSAKSIITNGVTVATEDKSKITYHNESYEQELVYNTLIVPYGKTFEVILSDHTKVYLNTGSSLKYPIKFLENQPRTVFLEGEAYFDVVKTIDKSPFVVTSGGVEINVLGTSFNVTSYKEDKKTEIVLVEGLVALYSSSNKNETILKPNQLAVKNDTDKEFSVKSVDVSNYIAWKYGKEVFKNVRFADIIKKLERKHNVKITCNNTALKNKRYTASFQNEGIKEILEAFSKNYAIEYVIEDNEVVIE